jgi:Rps23 Pro-64 3,4-dihydroxylase Tpa1-like proline 4-hydroxylase
MPLESSKNDSFMKGWDPKWGGALELFPVENGDEVGLPGVKSVKRIDVKWGQIVFFEAS